MLIAVVSDTHHDNSSIREVLSSIENADVLIHLGDNVIDALFLKERFKGESYYVKGNCDGWNSAPKELLIDIKGIKIFATHGDGYGVKISDTMLLVEAKERGADIALYGHTHIPTVEEKQGIWVINPGSPSLPRMSKASIAFIDIDNNGRITPYIYNI